MPTDPFCFEKQIDLYANCTLFIRSLGESGMRITNDVYLLINVDISVIGHKVANVDNRNKQFKREFPKKTFFHAL